MIPFAASTAATAAAKTANAFEWPGQPPKLLLPLGGSGPPSNTWYLPPTRVIIPNGITIHSAVFVWVANAILYNALSVERKAPKSALSPWDFVTLPEEDRATAIGNTHRKIGTDRACGSGDMLANRQTNTQTHRRAHHNTASPLP